MCPGESLIAIAPVSYEPDGNDTLFVTAGYLDTLRKEQPEFRGSLFPSPDGISRFSQHLPQKLDKMNFIVFMPIFFGSKMQQRNYPK